MLTTFFSRFFNIESPCRVVVNFRSSLSLFLLIAFPLENGVLVLVLGCFILFCSAFLLCVSSHFFVILQ